jgi:hypothetical protein
VVTIRESLIILQNRKTTSREDFAKAAKVGKQRAYGIVDVLEDIGLVDIDRSIRPFQIHISDLGKKFIPLLTDVKPPELMKTIVGKAT